MGSLKDFEVKLGQISDPSDAGDDDEISTSSNMEKKGKTNKVISNVKNFVSKYKCYLIVIFAIFLFLLILKPKFLLKVRMAEPDIAVQEIDPKLFLRYWLIFSLVGCAGMYYYINVYCKKKQECAVCGS